MEELGDVIIYQRKIDGYNYNLRGNIRYRKHKDDELYTFEKRKRKYLYGLVGNYIWYEIFKTESVELGKEHAKANY